MIIVAHNRSFINVMLHVISHRAMGAGITATGTRTLSHRILDNKDMDVGLGEYWSWGKYEQDGFGYTEATMT